MRGREEDSGSRVSQLQVVSRCGGSGDKPLWHSLGLPSLRFSSHCSTSCLCDRSHLAWQREWRHSTVPPSQVWPLHATRQRVQANKMHACTYTILHTPPPSPPEAVTWLLTQRSCGPAVRHYDKYTKGRGVLSARSQPSQL